MWIRLLVCLQIKKSNPNDSNAADKMTKLYLMIQDLRFQRTWSRKKSRTPSRTAMQPLQWERVQKINPMITSKRICQTLRNQGPPF